MPTAAKPKPSKATAETSKKKTPAGRKPMTEAAITKALKTLHGWTYEGDTIRKTYKFSNYLAGLAFATTVGTVAEGFDHHPDIVIQWRKVTLSFATHDAGNKVTPTDIKVAQAIDALPYKPET